MYTFTVALLAASSLISVAAAHPHHSHAHIEQRSLPSTWHHQASHPVHALFARQDATKTSPEPGSPAWVATFPSWSPDANQMPQSWKDSLNAAVAAKRIPAIPVSKSGGDSGIPTYPQGFDPNDPKSACSATYGCRLPGDIWDAPDGVWGISFDDGPLPDSSDKLYAFLQKENQHATHFMIGTNILGALNQFKFAYETLKDDIAVHTWTHPQMTTLSNEQVVAELGYTIQVIHDLTGGRVPRFWRPPTGDSDARVTAIAREVFGLITMIWNQDTADWSITEGKITVDKVNQNLEQWFSGPKSPGMIILEHELSDQSVGTFITSYEKGIKAGWKAVPATSNIITNATVYRNAVDDDAAPVPMNLAVVPGASTIALIATSTTASTQGSALNGTSSSVSLSATAALSITDSKTFVQGVATGAVGSHSVSPTAGSKSSASVIACPALLMSTLLFLLVLF